MVLLPENADDIARNPDWSGLTRDDLLTIGDWLSTRNKGWVTLKYSSNDIRMEKTLLLQDFRNQLNETADITQLHGAPLVSVQWRETLVKGEETAKCVSFPPRII